MASLVTGKACLTSLNTITIGLSLLQLLNVDDPLLPVHQSHLTLSTLLLTYTLTTIKYRERSSPHHPYGLA